MNMDYSAYEGFNVQGKVDTVISRGRVDLGERRVLRQRRTRSIREARVESIPDVETIQRGKVHRTNK